MVCQGLCEWRRSAFLAGTAESNAITRFCLRVRSRMSDDFGEYELRRARGRALVVRCRQRFGAVRAFVSDDAGAGSGVSEQRSAHHAVVLAVYAATGWQRGVAGYREERPGACPREEQHQRNGKRSPHQDQVYNWRRPDDC